MNCPIVDCITNDWIMGKDEIHKEGDKIRLFPFQRRILNHMFTPGKDGKLPYRTCTYSTIKKSGKTELSAAVTYAFIKVYGGLGLSVANDKDQATNNMFARILRMIGRMKRYDPSRYEAEIARETKDSLEFFPDAMRVNGQEAEIRSIPCDPYGEAGHERLAFVNYDELWAYGKSDITWRLWTELQPIPNIPYSMRYITTYAGFYGESEVLWSIYEQACKPDPDTHVEVGTRAKGIEDLPVFVEGDLCAYWDHEGRMPWHTSDFLEAARTDPVNQKRRSEYLRLWENRWTTGAEAFLDMDVFDRLAAQGMDIGLSNQMP